jgi:primosomal protein N' (replication factor Y)
LPELHCINLKAQKNLVDGLSQPLIQAIKKHLETPFPNQAKNQILLFINRRGFAPMMMCHECGWQAICPRCDKPYTLHIHPTRLSCHHCEVQKNILSHCPECDSQAPLSDVGIGTEKIELALQTLFPDRKILRIDRTNTTKKNSMEKHLAQIESGEADILVGTQMLAKGHHFENLSMVGVIKIDDALFSNDFRSSEHLGQLLTQVAGRAGREKTQGEVYIQTHHIDHPLLNLLLTEGYSNYAKALLEERKATNFPPFSYLALIRAEGHSLEQNHQALREIKSHLQNFSNALYAKHSGILPPTTPQENPLNCLGPFPAFLAKKGGIYRSQLLIQSQERKILHQTLNQLQIFLKQNPIKKIRIFFDIDPIELD